MKAEVSVPRWMKTLQLYVAPAEPDSAARYDRTRRTLDLPGRLQAMEALDNFLIS